VLLIRKARRKISKLILKEKQYSLGAGGGGAFQNNTVVLQKNVVA
jgi:hypothetical protein